MYEILRTNKLERLLKIYDEGRSMDAASANQLESSLAQSPDDVESRARLLGYYLLPPAGPESRRPKQEYREHLKWVIEKMPTDALGPFAISSVPFEDDPQIFPELDRLWSQKLRENPTNFDICFNMSLFYESARQYGKALEMAIAARKLKGKDTVVDRRVRFLRGIVREDELRDKKKQKET